MEQNHSPLPWKCDVRVGCIAIYPASMPKEETQCLAGANSWAIHYKPGRQKVDSKQIEWEVDPEDEANAQFIVQACNNFDSMLESLREVRFVLRMSSMKQYWGEPWAKKLDATITKAEAKL